MMKHTRQFEIAQELLVKKAVMDKLIESVKQYRPFNIDDAAGATPTTALAGAGLGALLGGGSAAIQGAFMKDEDEEGRKTKKPSILGRALLGAGLGGLGGAALPQLGMTLTPYVNRAAGEHMGAKALESFDTKWPSLLPKDGETAGTARSLVIQTQNAVRNKVHDAASAAGRSLANEYAPQLTIGQMIEMMRNPKRTETVTRGPSPSQEP